MIASIHYIAGKVERVYIPSGTPMAEIDAMALRMDVACIEIERVLG